MATQVNCEEGTRREPPPPCAHHWVIEPPDGATSRGACLKCGAVQDFRNTIPPKGWNGQRPTPGAAA